MQLGTRAGRSPRAFAQTFALVAGAAYVLGGIGGFFVTGFSGWFANDSDAVFILEVNPFHNIVHIGVGALWLFAGVWLIRAGTEGVNLAIGGVYVLAAILGYLGFLSILSIDGPFAPDNFLHLITGAVAVVFAGWAGLVNPRADAESPELERV